MTDEKIQEPLNTAKKYIEEAIGIIKHDGHLGIIPIDWRPRPERKNNDAQNNLDDDFYYDGGQK